MQLILNHQNLIKILIFILLSVLSDSGGPLFVNGIQVGVMSFSVNPCNASGKPK